MPDCKSLSSLVIRVASNTKAVAAIIASGSLTDGINLRILIVAVSTSLLIGIIKRVDKNSLNCSSCSFEIFGKANSSMRVIMLTNCTLPENSLIKTSKDISPLNKSIITFESKTVLPFIPYLPYCIDAVSFPRAFTFKTTVKSSKIVRRRSQLSPPRFFNNAASGGLNNNFDRCVISGQSIGERNI